MADPESTTVREDRTGGRAPGRRELNKRRTRAAIRDSAKELFLDRGFDAVSVAEIADRAGVTEKTVFNHFPTKEDLVYAEMEQWEQRMVSAIRDRGHDQTVLEAFRHFVSGPAGLLAGSEQDHDALAKLTRLILDTPSLRAREARTIDRYTDVLAEVLAVELGIAPGDPRAWIVANALMGVHRALLDHVRRGIVAGRPARRLAAEVRRIARDSCETLGSGIDSVAGGRDPVRRSARRRSRSAR